MGYSGIDIMCTELTKENKNRRDEKKTDYGIATLSAFERKIKSQILRKC